MDIVTVIQGSIGRAVRTVGLMNEQWPIITARAHTITRAVINGNTAGRRMDTGRCDRSEAEWTFYYIELFVFFGQSAPIYRTMEKI